jgi:Tfp pilus assembly protein PilF
MKQYLKKIFEKKEDKRKLAEEYYTIGITHGENKNYAESLNYFQKAIDIDPLYADAYTGMGTHYFFQKEIDVAKTCYERSIELDPNNVKPYFNLGLIYEYKREYQTAIDYLQTALEIDPEYIKAKNVLNQTKELLSNKNRIDSYSYNLKEMVKSFDCPDGHTFIIKECPYCKLFYKNAVKEIDFIESQLSQFSLKVFSHYDMEERADLVEMSDLYNQSYLVRKSITGLTDLVKLFENAFFDYPMPQWDIKQIRIGWEQLVYDFRGFTADRCFENINPEDIRNMFEGFHYSYTGYEETKIKNVYKLCFEHKVKIEIFCAYCFTENIERLDNTPYYFQVMPFGVNENGLLVTMSIKNEIVKIHTQDGGLGVRAEYAYLKQKYLFSDIKTQKLSTKTIENILTKVDILTTDNGEEIIFDISDFYGKTINGKIFFY